MSLPTLIELTQKVEQVSKKITESFGLKINYLNKSDETPVTKIDRYINQLLCDWADFKGFGFIGEEGNGSEKAEFYLYADPLDGTGAYLRGMATMTTVACIMSHDGIPLMAVIHNPVTKQTWAAKQGCGTHYTFDEFASIVRVDNPVSGPWLTAICAWPGVDATYADFDRAVNNDRRFSDQKMGAFGLGGGLIASGLLHATTISSKSAVETAAMSLIVREAGGLVCDLYGGPLTKFKLGKNNGKVDFLLPRGAILACNHQVLSALVKLYKQH